MSEFRTPLPDPNRGQNRIPSQMELVTLRNIRSDQRQMVDSAKRQLGTAKENYLRIQIRHENLVRDMESVLSELNFSHAHLEMLERQLGVLQTEDDRLTGLLHPIRRCPEDVLVMIFDSIIQIDPQQRFRSATTLSHVCKAWRVTALNTRSLWNQIKISLVDEVSAMNLFMERTRSRLRSGPVSLRLKDIPMENDVTEKVVKCIQLDQFEAVIHLHFVIASADDVECLLEAPLIAIPPPTTKLTIQALEMVEGSQPFNVSEHLRRSPTLKFVTLKKVGQIHLDGDDAFPLIQELHLEQVEMPTFAQNLHRFLGLEKIDIRLCGFKMLPLTQDVVLPNLLEMEIGLVDGFPWDRLSSPQLRGIMICEMSDEEVGFICRHPSLRHLDPDVWYDGDMYKTLAKALINLESLSTGRSIQELYKQTEPNISHPLFPKLRRIEIHEGPQNDHPLSLREFEDLVRSRCLHHNPDGHQEGVERVSEIVIIAENYEERPWLKSPLMSHFQMTVSRWKYEENKSSLTLKLTD